MSKFNTDKITQNVEDTLEAVAQSLREASDRTHDLSEEASEALSDAAKDVVRVAEKLRKQAVDATRDVARQASNEIKEHPIVSLAAALTAVAALVGVIAASRSGKNNPK